MGDITSGSKKFHHAETDLCKEVPESSSSTAGSYYPESAIHC